MSVVRITLAAVGAAFALAVTAGCGGGNSQSVPAGAVAVVDGTVITKAALDHLLDQTKKSYVARKQAFPKAGTPEYQSLQTQWVQYLVQLEELRQTAADLGIKVSSKDVDKVEKQLIDSQFGGKRAQYVKALKQQGLTAKDYRSVLERQVLTTKIFDEVTKDVKVTQLEVLDYYGQNEAQYPETRDVRHILLAEKGANGKVDFAKSKAEADRIYAELKAGASFAALAKANSADPGSKDSGGKLTISKGQTVPEFEKVAFALKEGEISKPVKTQFGYHIIEALSPVKKTKFESVRETIRQTLLQQKRNEAMQAWVDDLTKKYENKVSYASGFEPPELPEVPTTATE
jgi:foldase protein PrsA